MRCDVPLTASEVQILILHEILVKSDSTLQEIPTRS